MANLPAGVTVTVTPGGAAATSLDVNVPAMVNGDKAIMWFINDGGATTTIPAGWSDATATSQGVVGGAGLAAFIAEYTASGTEAATTVNVTYGANEKGVALVFKIPASLASAVYISDINGDAGNGNPDPASFSPSPGSDTYTWIALGGHDNGSRTTADPAGYPTDYADGTIETDYGHLNDVGLEPGNAGTSAGVGAHWGTNSTTAASEDPGAFALSTTDGWLAAVIAIGPGGGGGGGGQSPVPSIFQQMAA